MKRFLFILLILPLFSGCFLFNSFGRDDKEVSTTVEVQQPGDVFLVKLNVSDDIVKGEKTGYVSGTSRSAGGEDKEYDTDRFIRDRNNELYKKLSDCLASKERSAEQASANPSRTSPRTFAENEDFYAYVTTNNKAGTVNAERQYDGEHCYIYADKDLSDEIKAQCTTLGQKFDSCYSNEIEIIGNPYYDSNNSQFFVPCNNKIVILVYDLFGDATPGQQSGTAGYFNPYDLFLKSFLDSSSYFNKGISESSVDYLHTNECEMYYIDSQFLKETPDKQYSTLVHEFNHLINFVIKTVKYMYNKNSISSLRYCDTWFTEMLAMTTEDMFQDYLKLKDEDTSKGRLMSFGMNYFYGFTASWDSSLESYIPYANTYAFGAFLARNFGGIELIKQIAQNDEVNEMAITKALQTIDPNTTYKDEKTGITKHIDFKYALRKFTLCVINTSRDDVYSLNRGTGKKNGLVFNPIDITGTFKYQGTTYQVPITFKANQDGQLDIYPTGFTVHYVGHNLSSFTFCTTNMDDLEYYVVQ